MRHICLILVTAILAFGCSKAPKDSQGQAKAPAAYEPNKVGDLLTKGKNVNLGGVDEDSITLINLPVLGDNATAIYDAKVKFNSSQPIIYGKGAGGVDYTTGLSQAESILSTPRVPPNGDGDVIYDEGLYVRWRHDGDRTMVFMIVLSGYLGPIQMPTPLQPMFLGHDFIKDGYTPNSKASAEKLARDYYRIFENKDASADCVATNQCQVIWQTDAEKNFIIGLPGITLLVSKDRLVLFRIMFQPRVPLGILENNVELTSGSILVPEEAAIAFGDQYQTVESRWEKSADTAYKPNTSVAVNTFGRSYGSAYLIYDRTKYDRKSIEALPEDVLRGMQVYGDFPGLFLIGGKSVLVTESESQITLALVDPAQKVPTEEEQKASKEKVSPLRLGMAVSKKHVLSFTQQVRDLLITEIKALYPNATVASSLQGIYQLKTNKSYSTYITAYDKATDKGIFTQVNVDEESGNISAVLILGLGGKTTPFDSLVMPEFETPVAKAKGSDTFTELAGFKVGSVIANPLTGGQMVLPGSKIEITDWDIGRNEATATLVGTKLTERVTFNEQALETFAFGNEKTTNVFVSTINVSSLNTSLVLKLEKDDGVKRTYAVTAVRSPLKTGAINGLCNGQFDAKFGMSSRDFLSSLNTTKDCGYLTVDDKQGHGRLQEVYFPSEGIRISFSDNEISMATVYTPEVK